MRVAVAVDHKRLLVALVALVAAVPETILESGWLGQLTLVEAVAEEEELRLISLTVTRAALALL